MRHHKKELPTRRRTAARWGLLLAILVCLTSVFRLYIFLPSQARYLAEEASNTGSTDLVCRKWYTERDGEKRLVSISHKGDTVLLSGASFHLLTGWRPDFDYAYDCHGTALSGSVTLEGTGFLAKGFLRVGDPNVETVVVSIWAPGERQEETEERTGVELMELTTVHDTWVTAGNYRYVLLAADVEEAIDAKEALYGPIYLHATAYDSSGAITAEYDSCEDQEAYWPW